MRLSGLVLTVLLAACAGQPPAESRADPLTSGQVHLELVRGMLNQGQHYAALAHIEDLRRQGESGPMLRYLEAEALRRLQRVKGAEAVYLGLLKTELAPQAYQGLGLLLADSDLPRALGYLRKAARKAPTDAGIRNDMGYALMLAGRYPEALAELSTAAELAPGSDLSVENLTVLMLLMNDEPSARRVAREAGLDDARWNELRRRAQDLKKRS